MALPTFDKREAIPAGFEDEYEERDGKWQPIDHVAPLRSAIKEEREAREKAELVARKAAKDAADLSAKQLASEGGMTAAKLKELYDKIEFNKDEEMKPKLEELERMRAENRELKLDSKVKAMFQKGGALATRIDDFWTLHKPEFDLTTDGKPMVKNEPGKDVERHVQGILKARGEWVQGTKAAGGRSNALPSTTPASGLNPGGLSFEDVVKNPGSAIAVANEQ